MRYPMWDFTMLKMEENRRNFQQRESKSDRYLHIPNLLWFLYFYSVFFFFGKVFYSCFKTISEIRHHMIKKTILFLEKKKTLINLNIIHYTS